MNAITQAIECFGGARQMAGYLHVTDKAVYHWKSGRSQMPAEKCPDVEIGTNRKVTCEMLRPDVNWSALRTGAISEQDAAEPILLPTRVPPGITPVSDRRLQGGS